MDAIPAGGAGDAGGAEGKVGCILTHNPTVCVCGSTGVAGGVCWGVDGGCKEVNAW